MVVQTVKYVINYPIKYLIHITTGVSLKIPKYHEFMLTILNALYNGNERCMSEIKLKFGYKMNLVFFSVFLFFCFTEFGYSQGMSVAKSNYPYLAEVSRTDNHVYFDIKDEKFFANKTLHIYQNFGIKNGKMDDQCGKLIVDNNLSFVLALGELYMKGVLQFKNNKITLKTSFSKMGNTIFENPKDSTFDLDGKDSVAQIILPHRIFHKDNFTIKINDTYTKSIYTSCSTDPFCKYMCYGAPFPE